VTTVEGMLRLRRTSPTFTPSGDDEAAADKAVEDVVAAAKDMLRRRRRASTFTSSSDGETSKACASVRRRISAGGADVDLVVEARGCLAGAGDDFDDVSVGGSWTISIGPSP
jgi:hypothetical protein